MHRKAIILLLLWSFVTACKQEQALSSTPKVVANELTFRVFRMKDGTFGYDILQLGKILVHQPFIPAYGGNIGFAKKHYAKATAQLMMNKMNQGIFPPSLTRLEIDSILGVK